jgi:hypothetical protein
MRFNESTIYLDVDHPFAEVSWSRCIKKPYVNGGTNLTLSMLHQG